MSDTVGGFGCGTRWGAGHPWSEHSGRNRPPHPWVGQGSGGHWLEAIGGVADVVDTGARTSRFSRPVRFPAATLTEPGESPCRHDRSDCRSCFC